MIDIIIPTCKEYPEVEPQIKAIQAVTQSVRVIATCQPVSAAINRNIGLDWSGSESIIMMDDDITGFYHGWLSDLLMPLILKEDIFIVSARLIQPDGKLTMGAAEGNNEKDFFQAENDRVSTGCVAIRKNPVRFHEGFTGSGYEDTAYCNAIKSKYGPGKIWVNNLCRLTHLNEMKNQGGEYWKHNKELYLALYPNDQAVVGQEDWTND